MTRKPVAKPKDKPQRRARGRAVTALAAPDPAHKKVILATPGPRSDVVEPGFHVIELVQADALTPYAKNARIHPPEQIEKLAAIIEARGYVGSQAVGFDSVSILFGHARTAAVRLIYARGGSIFWAGSRKPIPAGFIPAVRIEGWTDEERTAAILADNRAGLDATWDLDMVAEELRKLAAANYELAATAFDSEETAKLLKQSMAPAKNDPDDAPALPPKPVSKLGDVWVLGPHRLACGDATQPATVEALFAGAHADMLLMDPPYCSGGFQEAGKGVGSIGSKQIKKGGRFAGGIANDKLSTRGYMALMKGVLALTPAPVIYAFTDWRMWINLYDVAESSGFGVRNMIVWDKGTPGMGRGWRTQHELVLFGSKAPIEFDNHKAVGNVLSAKRTGNLLHPTQKPVEILQAILGVTPGGRNVYDPFTGSGSTLMACEAHEAPWVFFGLEMSPAFVDVTVKRWQDHTGQAAILEKSGQTFAAVAVERGDGRVT